MHFIFINRFRVKVSLDHEYICIENIDMRPVAHAVALWHLLCGPESLQVVARVLFT